MQSGIRKSSLLNQHIPVVTRSVKGKFRNFKTAIMILAYSVYFLLPWMPWTRVNAPNQALLFDLSSRRFYVFDLIVYPQDIFWLAMLLFIAATLLFFVTGLVGRAWCGYFCFQTIWSDLFIQIERLIQGERPARLRLIKQDWSTEKVMKVASSHGLMVIVSFWTAVTFASYFMYAPDFVHQLFTGDAPYAGYITVLVLTITTYLAGGVIREKICTFCPYARFQSVMFEQDTLLVTYDKSRGEGLKGRSIPIVGVKGHEDRVATGHGDCIDCGFCVQVCPTGIDIRKGLQFECISCGLCIDACNNIMDSVGYPRGLIRYDSERNIGAEKPKAPRLEWKRLKVLGYAGALIAMTSLLVYSISTRIETEVTVIQVRQPLFVVLSDGQVRNRYQINIVNKTAEDQIYKVSVEGIPTKALDMGSLTQFKVRAGESLGVNAKVDLGYDQARRHADFKFIIIPNNPKIAHFEIQTNFSSPRD